MTGNARSGRTGQLLVAVPFALALICGLVNVAWKLLESPSDPAYLIDWLYNLTFVLGGLHASVRRASPGCGCLARLRRRADRLGGDIYWTDHRQRGQCPYRPPPTSATFSRPRHVAGVALLCAIALLHVASCFRRAIGALAATALGTAFPLPR